MKPKIYYLLYFQQLCDNYSNWIFPLHEGENIIGSDKNVDIFLYLNRTEDTIESVHCKIIVDENKNDIGIISLTDKGFVKRIDNNSEKKIILSPGKIYELKNKSIFYLTDNIKFMLIKGTLDEIYSFFSEIRLENEYQKWYQFILNQKNIIKLNLNLPRKDSLNKSIISNVSNNNIINRSNTKEMNRIGFNNFDEVVDDNLLNDNSNINISPIKNNKINKFLEIKKNDKEMHNKENQNIKEKNSENIDKPEIKNEKENLVNKDNILNNTFKQNYSDLTLYKKSSSEFIKKNNIYEEKIINKDEKTIKLIKELLGENNLEIIIKNTNFKKIKKFDISLKKANKSGLDKGNFNIIFDNNYYKSKKKSNNK